MCGIYVNMSANTTNVNVSDFRKVINAAAVLPNAVHFLWKNLKECFSIRIRFSAARSLCSRVISRYLLSVVIPYTVSFFFISVNQLLESDKTVESGTVDNIKFDFRQIDLLSRIFVAENGNWFCHYKIAKFFVLYDILGSFLYRSPCIQPFFYNFKNALINEWYKLIKILIILKK